jgi:anti-sigma factor RsiW
MQCLEASELISLRLDQQLSAEQEQALRAHLVDCQICQKEWQMMQRVTALFDKVSLKAPPPAMGDRIMATIRQRDSRLAGWRRGILWSLGAIVALVLGSISYVGISSLVISALEQPSIIRTLAEAMVQVASIVTMILDVLAIFIRALLTSPMWPIMVVYLILAGALLLAWTRLVTRSYRVVAERQQPQ